jgi:hypothetical protein
VVPRAGIEPGKQTERLSQPCEKQRLVRALGFQPHAARTLEAALGRALIEALGEREVREALVDVVREALGDSSPHRTNGDRALPAVRREDPELPLAPGK